MPTSPTEMVLPHMTRGIPVEQVIPGTASTAVRNADGSWNILDVPIMAEGPVARFNKRGEKVDDFEFTPDWMEAAIQVAAMRETSERFMGRAFEDHHNSPGSQPDAGYIRPKRTVRITLDGEEVTALCADLIAVPDEVYQRIKANRLPYRSIESHCETNFIHGLALMPTKGPRFRLPMLTIAREVVANATDAGSEPARELLACASAERAIAAFEVPPVSVPQVAEPEAQPGAGTPPANARQWRQEPGKPPVHPAPEARAEGDQGAGEKPGDEKKCEAVQKLLDGLSKFKGTPDEVAELVHALQEWIAGIGQGGHDKDAEDKLGGPPPEQEKKTMTKANEQTPPVDPAANGTPPVTPVTPPVTPPVVDGDAMKIAMAAEAKADIAVANTAAIQAERDTEKAVAKAAAELKRYNIGSDPMAVLAEKVEKYGLDALPMYVDSVKAHAPESPETVGDETEQGVTDLVDLPDEVNAYAGDDRILAIKASREYDRFVEMEYPMDDRETWIRSAIALAKREGK